MKKKIKPVRKTCIDGSKISLLKDEIRKLFGEKVNEIVNVGVTNV